MATTETGAALTEAHQARQVALKASATGTSLALWRLLDPEDLDGTMPGWLDANTAVVEQLHDRSQQVAGSYFASFAQTETGRFYDPPPKVPLNHDRLRANLAIAGPVQVKGLLRRGHPLDRALSTAQVRSAGEAARFTLEGHRNMLLGAMTADFGSNPRPVGYARVTAASPCAFCAMLASRGPVFSQSTVGFRAHGHCACSAEPVFRRSQPWPGRSREFHDLWNRSTVGLQPGDKPLNAFRRALSAN